MAVNFIIGDVGNIGQGAAYNPDAGATFTDAVSGSAGALVLRDTGPIPSQDIPSGNIKLTATVSGTYAGAVVGVFAFVAFTAGATADRYEIETVDGSGDFIIIDTPWVAGSLADDVFVGGSAGSNVGASGIRDILDSTTAGSFVHVLGDLAMTTGKDGGAGFVLQTTVDGTVVAPITIEGVNGSTGARLSRNDILPIISYEDGATITSLLDFDSDSIAVIALEFDALDNLDSANDTIILASILSIHNKLIDCKIHNAPTKGNGITGTAISQLEIFGCEIYDVGNIGIANTSLTASVAIIGNSVHDCETGITAVQNNTIKLNTIFDNGTGGGVIITGDVNYIDDNIIDSNAGPGIDVGSGSELNYITNNKITNNTEDGIDWLDVTDGWLSQTIIAGNNGWANNGTGDGSGNTSGGTWALLDAIHANSSVAPGYVSTTDGAENHTPTHSTNNWTGYPRSWGVNGVLDAIENFKTPGAITREEPKRYPRLQRQGAE